MYILEMVAFLTLLHFCQLYQNSEEGQILYTAVSEYCNDITKHIWISDLFSKFGSHVSFSR